MNAPERPVAHTAPGADIRVDLRLIADMIEPGSRILDVGCGDGALLDYLWRVKGVDGRGMEIRRERVRACVAQGLSVIQGNAETDLLDYPAKAFDYVVLSQTLQAVHEPHVILRQLTRVSRRAIVSILNYGHWRNRLTLLWGGRMPVAERTWYDTDNIHPCTLRDFVALCDDQNLTIERALFLSRTGKARDLKTTGWVANLTGEQGIFVVSES